MHTQCPKCRTIFNVTEEILAVKAGLVRCGDCENVFNATWHLVDDSGQPETDEEFTPAAGARTHPASDGDAVQQDADQSPPPAEAEIDAREAPADDVDFTAETDTAVAMENDVAEGNDWQDAEASGATTGLETDSGDTEEISDEEIDRMLRLDEPLAPEEDSSGEESSTGRTDIERDPDKSPLGRRQRVEPRLDATPGLDISVNAEDRLIPRRAGAHSSPDRKRSPLRRKPAIQLKPLENPDRGPSKRAGESGKREVPHTSRNDPNVHWVSIPDGDRRGARFLWGAGVLVLIAVLFLQVRFFLVDELYSIPATRPYISIFCEFSGCSAPQRTDPGAIEIAQTRVDLHPDIPGAIRIKINLINRAPFAQPYPSLQLTLTDKDGRIVGRRTYAARDYLDGEATGPLLDPGTLAVVSINLAHPNENAVGFETEVVAGVGA
jgi:predicted Zn finger-like uncharacterized protein